MMADGENVRSYYSILSPIVTLWSARPSVSERARSVSLYLHARLNRGVFRGRLRKRNGVDGELLSFDQVFALVDVRVQRLVGRRDLFDALVIRAEPRSQIN